MDRYLRTSAYTFTVTKLSTHTYDKNYWHGVWFNNETGTASWQYVAWRYN